MNFAGAKRNHRRCSRLDRQAQRTLRNPVRRLQEEQVELGGVSERK